MRRRDPPALGSAQVREVLDTGMVGLDQGVVSNPAAPIGTSASSIWSIRKTAGKPVRSMIKGGRRFR